MYFSHERILIVAVNISKSEAKIEDNKTTKRINHSIVYYR